MQEEDHDSLGEKKSSSQSKKAGQRLHNISWLMGHARESSLHVYDEITEDERRQLAHIVSGHVVSSASACAQTPKPSTSTTGNQHWIFSRTNGPKRTKTRGDMIVSSPVPRGKARNSRARWGRVDGKETDKRKTRGETPPSDWSNHRRILLGHFERPPAAIKFPMRFRNRKQRLF